MKSLCIVFLLKETEVRLVTGVECGHVGVKCVMMDVVSLCLS